jgi:cobalt-zinc-cadmium efflux system protein
VFGDVGASVAVIVAGAIILLTRWNPIDPLLSIGIAVLIAFGAWRILRETVDILLEAVPKDVNLSALVRDMMRVKGVQDVHDLHVWCITSGMYALSCHTQIADLPPSQSATILASLESMLREKYSIGHTAIQFESYAHVGSCCADDGLYCRMKLNKGDAHLHDHEHEHEHEHEHST